MIDPTVPHRSSGLAGDPETVDEELRPHLHVHSVTLTGLFILAVLSALHLGRVVFLPITIALLFAVLFAPLMRRLKHIRIPEPVSAAILLSLLMAALIYGVTRLAEPASEWAGRVPDAFREAESKLRVLKQPMQDVTKATEMLSKATALDGAKKVPQVEVKNDAWPMKFFSVTGEFLIELATTLILLYFLLSSGDMFLQKLVKVLPKWSDKRRAVEIVRQVEEQLFQYLFTVTCINVGLGTLVGTAMYFLEMPNPILWGTMAALLTFIPYLGHMFGIVVVTLVATLTFDDLGHVLLISGAYGGLALLEGWFVTPMILGQRLEINPVVLLIGLMLWGWIWGIGGAFLAVPILVTFKIVCDHIQPLQAVGEFLGRKIDH
ncbi:MAG TPA: AI-2E family transporter [Nitrospira sp.]|nr:AI-2E family transporter [Nitrospira sp.]